MVLCPSVFLLFWSSFLISMTWLYTPCWLLAWTKVQIGCMIYFFHRKKGEKLREKSLDSPERHLSRSAREPSELFYDMSVDGRCLHDIMPFRCKYRRINEIGRARKRIFENDIGRECWKEIDQNDHPARSLKCSQAQHQLIDNWLHRRLKLLYQSFWKKWSYGCPPLPMKLVAHSRYGSTTGLIHFSRPFPLQCPPRWTWIYFIDVLGVIDMDFIRIYSNNWTY